MSISDPLADMLTIIRNASRAKLKKVDMPSSKFKLEILRVLKTEGYIKHYKYIADNRQGRVRIYLRFNKEGRPAIGNIKRISKPGLRVYADRNNIPRVLRGMGTALISTSSGVVTDAQARREGVGGEIICYVW